MSVNPLTDDLQRFSKLKAVWVGTAEETAQRLTVEGFRFHRSHVILKLGGIESRSAADALRESFVFVEETASVSPKQGSYFIHDIVGMTVTTEGGEILGTVEEVWRMPANDVWVVRQNGKEILLPAINEIVRSVDLTRRAITIHAMEGLIE